MTSDIGNTTQQFQEWQIRKLKILLKQYKSAENLGLVKLAADVSEYSGDSIKKSTIGLFVNDFDKEGAAVRLSTLRTIAKFLMNKDIGLLTPEGLYSEKVKPSVPISFIKSLGCDITENKFQIDESFYGTYFSQNKGYLLELNLDNKIKSSYFRVNITCRYALNNDVQEMRFDGWGILTPENMLFFHLRHSSCGRNIFWSSPEYDFKTSREPDQHIELSYYNYPVNKKENKGSFLFSYIDILNYEKYLKDAKKELSAKTCKEMLHMPFLRTVRHASLGHEENTYEGLMSEKELSQEELGEMLIKTVCDVFSEASDVQKLLDQGAPVNYVHPYRNSTALHCAASMNSFEKVRTLAAHPDIKFNVIDKSNFPPSGCAFLQAAGGCNEEMTKFLTEKEEQERAETRKQAENKVVPIQREP